MPAHCEVPTASAKQLYYKEWYAKNKSRRQAQGYAHVQEWQRQNRDRVLEHKRKYRERHREQEVLRRKKYIEDNRARILERAREYRRRAKLNQSRDKQPQDVPRGGDNASSLKLQLSFVLN
ncbi:hypothetical protein H257_15177 [Aphanomyces astaci]|uniref:Uncharacterized protein n=1 Tax=Aphanomyces astaci TaxID=112090 RepID=W4FQD2_APHAT|nr:hypothetical protein H257_15177 [Aphanomyces astaci]ETV69024.1 hypothetical protein H257_15177 [Aphanomyces astaci]|eukprot:XP_009841483.1 hypothetical protein H257_15177 [Aphanomyces astaci]